MKLLDVSAAVIIGLIAAAFLMMTGGLGRTAAMFPKILSVTIIVLVAIYIGAQIYIQFKTLPAGPSGKEAGGNQRPPEDFFRSSRWYTIIGLIGVYMGLIYLIGFGAASFSFATALPYCGGYRKMKVVLPVALGMTIVLVGIGMLFDIPLPVGLWATLF